MAVLDAITAESKDRLEKIGQAELVVALPSFRTGESLRAAAAGLESVLPTLPGGGKAVLLYPAMAGTAVVEQQSLEGGEVEIGALESGGPANGAVENAAAPVGETALHLVPCALPSIERVQQASLDQSLLPLCQAGRLLGAQACVIIGAQASISTPDDVRALAEPILKQVGCDLAVPLYPVHKFESLINSGVVHPLVRALYGIRVRFPMAIDLALSARMADLYLLNAGGRNPQCGWPAITAACAGFQVCQVHRESVAVPAAEAPADVSTSLAQVLGALYLDMEVNAAFWQRVRNSQPVRTFGQPRLVEQESAAAEVGHMIEVFQRGCKDLMDIWALAISPAALVDLRKLGRAPADQFRLSDGVWAHVLYDFALAHRQRVINREHLLRAMTPIYLGWVASYALEVQNFSPAAVEERLEKLAVAFETLKPYLLSRWRWPDRFNP